MGENEGICRDVRISPISGTSIPSQSPSKIHDRVSGDMPVLSDACSGGIEHSLQITDSQLELLKRVEEQENILHLQIENEDGVCNHKEVNEDTQVFFVYNDVHNCGVCNKQFVDLTEFLAHKSEHSIGENIYKCELCKLILASQCTLLKHYISVHGIKYFLAAQDESLADQTQISPETVHMLSSTTLDDIAPEETKTEPCEEQAEIQKTQDERKRKGVNSVIAQKIPRNVTRHKQSRGRRVVPTLLKKKSNLRKAEIANSNSAKHNRRLFLRDNPPQQSLSHIPIIEPAIDMPTVDNDISHVEKTSDGVSKCEINDADSHVDTTQNLEDEDGEISPNGKPGDSPKKDFSFVLQTELVVGSTFSYGRVWFKCFHCDYKCRGRQALKHHMTERHEALLQIHEVLDVKSTASKLGDKMKVMKMSSYEAMHCQDRKVRRKKRYRGMEKQDIPGAYPCNQCGKIFSRIRYLRKHQETHRTERTYVCEECGKSFKSRTYLRVHRQVHQDKVFKCHQCDFSSATKAAIHAHRQIHSQGSAICDICGYAYTDKSTLNKHKRVHDTSRPFACNFPGCAWRFKTEVMCKAHIRAHTTEGKFKCAYCGYVFRHKHHLKRHETNMHGIKHKNIISSEPLSIPDEKSMDSINIVISSDVPPEQLHLSQDLGQAQLVVATDSGGNPIAYETTDISAFCSSAYQAFVTAPDVVSEVESHVDDSQTILVSNSSSDTHAIIFHQ